MSIAVEFFEVGKRYRRGRERINLRAALPGRFGSSSRGDSHWALRHLTFELEAGHSLGLIGPNGAGKSTALKLVAGVVAPSTGRVSVTGRTASLIELGAGFHPDMTGRENVYFSAAVLGMPPRAIRSRFDDIVDFAGVGTFLDTPVKRYSSGMLARLGFAVATHLDAEVLVLDEVLAVGDAAFQRRCHDRIGQLCRSGVALLYVTHALWTLPMLCEQAILLVEGQAMARGTPVEVVQAYERVQQAGDLPPAANSSGVFRGLTSSAEQVDPGGDVTVFADLELEEAHASSHLLIMLCDAQLKVYAAASSRDGGIDLSRPGPHHVTCTWSGLPLQPGSYRIYVSYSADHEVPVVDEMRVLELQVAGATVAPSYGVLRVPTTWTAR